MYRRVRHAERFTWAATQGVNEEELLSNLPEDIQRDIRRHFFRFLNKVCNMLAAVLFNTVYFSQHGDDRE